jgi:hypothetical protein
MAYITQYTYTATGSTDTFAVPFPYVDSTHLTVTVNGTPTAFTELSYQTLQLASTPAASAAVKIVRNTNIDDAETDFNDAGSLFEGDLDLQTAQLLFKIQEMNTVIQSIGTNPGEPTPGVVIDTPVNDYFLVGEDTPLKWKAVTPAAAKALLGITDIPAPTATRTYLIANGSIYSLVNTNDVKADLGIRQEVGTGTGVYVDRLCPNPNNLANQLIKVNGAGNGYTTITPASLKTTMGFGTAADYDVGTHEGEIPLLIGPEVANGLGGTCGKLPVIDGSNLINLPGGGSGAGTEHVFIRGANASGLVTSPMNIGSADPSFGVDQYVIGLTSAASGWSGITPFMSVVTSRTVGGLNISGIDVTAASCRRVRVNINLHFYLSANNATERGIILSCGCKYNDQSGAAPSNLYNPQSGDTIVIAPSAKGYRFSKSFEFTSNISANSTLFPYFVCAGDSDDARSGLGNYGGAGSKLYCIGCDINVTRISAP